MNLVHSSRRLLVAIAIAIATVTSGIAAPTPAGEPYVIHVILPLTSTAAFLGQAEQQTLTVLQRLVNSTGGMHGRPLRFDFHDDQSNPALAVQTARSLMAGNPPVIIGSSISASCAAIAPIVLAKGPVQYCLSPGLTAKPQGYTFVSSVSIDYLQPAVVRFAREMGYRRIGVIAATDASGQESIRGLQRAMRFEENKDVQIVATEFVNPADINVTAQVLSVKAAGPQVVLASVTGTALGNVLRTLKDVGFTIPVITSGANANREQLISYAAFIPQEFYVNGFRFMDPAQIGPGPLRASINQMYAAFKSAGVPFSEAGSSFAWDPAKIVVESLRALEPSAGAEQLRDYIDTHQFVGINGIYNFRGGDQHGLSDRAIIMLRWLPQSGTWAPASGPRGLLLHR